MDNEDRPIDWERLSQSEDWIYIIRPQIERLRQESLLKLMSATQETYQILQGQALAYDDMLTMPEKRLKHARWIESELAKRKPKEENDEDKRPSWLRGIGRRLTRSRSYSDT